MLSAPQVDCKLYDDKITLVKFRTPEKEFKQLDEWRKVHLETGQVFLHTWQDLKRGERNFQASLTRTRNTMTQLSDKNRFYFFLTITFNKKYVDRSSAESVQKTFKNVLKRLKYHFEDISYLSVAEFHEDNENIHYHVLINFKRTPRLKYVGRSPKGYDMYHIHANEKFKRADCFLKLEKLKEDNNINYLLKYITKGYDFPFHRKFSCSRGLIRSQLLEKLTLPNSDKNLFSKVYTTCILQGFIPKFDYKHNCVLVFDTEPHSETAEPSAVDLLKLGTKDETLKEKYDKLLWELKKLIYVFGKTHEIE
ncbi:MAG: hypothetical protein FWE22_08500 [Firmicutes bacterium]|nr:hypothetical protein [Bacillota bacterium]